MSLEASVSREQIKTVGKAVETYMVNYRNQFSALGAQRREQNLKRFVRYLNAHCHSMQVPDLTYQDGLDFLNSLANAYDGAPITLEKKKRYKSALRSFSWFLVNSGVVKEGVFYGLNI